MCRELRTILKLKCCCLCMKCKLSKYKCCEKVQQQQPEILQEHDGSHRISAVPSSTILRILDWLITGTSSHPLSARAAQYFSKDRNKPVRSCELEANRGHQSGLYNNLLLQEVSWRGLRWQWSNFHQVFIYLKILCFHSSSLYRWEAGDSSYRRGWWGQVYSSQSDSEHSWRRRDLLWR